MAAREKAAGLAALSICESLLIALVEKGILGVEEACAALEDAAAAHQGSEHSDRSATRHSMACQIIERLITQVGAASRTDERHKE